MMHLACCCISKENSTRNSHQVVMRNEGSGGGGNPMINDNRNAVNPGSGDRSVHRTSVFTFAIVMKVSIIKGRESEVNDKKSKK